MFMKANKVDIVISYFPCVHHFISQQVVLEKGWSV